MIRVTSTFGSKEAALSGDLSFRIGPGLEEEEGMIKGWDIFKDGQW